MQPSSVLNTAIISKIFEDVLPIFWLTVNRSATPTYSN